MDGLSGLGFWLFIAIIIASDTWAKQKKRESKHETLRRLIENGQPADQQLLDDLLNSNSKSCFTKSAGVFWMVMSGGFVVFAAFLRFVSVEAFYVMLGIAGLIAFIGVATFVTAKYSASINEDEENFQALDK